MLYETDTNCLKWLQALVNVCQYGGFEYTLLYPQNINNMWVLGLNLYDIFQCENKCENKWLFRQKYCQFCCSIIKC